MDHCIAAWVPFAALYGLATLDHSLVIRAVIFGFHSYAWWIGAVDVEPVWQVPAL